MHLSKVIANSHRKDKYLCHTVRLKFLRDGMPMRPLGDSNMLVSKVGLGAMMWGEQTDEATAAAILDVAFDEFGVNLIVRDGFIFVHEYVGILAVTSYISFLLGYF